MRKKGKAISQNKSCVIWDLQHSSRCTVYLKWWVHDQISTWVLLKRSRKINKPSFFDLRHLRSTSREDHGRKAVKVGRVFPNIYLCFQSVCTSGRRILSASHCCDTLKCGFHLTGVKSFLALTRAPLPVLHWLSDYNKFYESENKRCKVQKFVIGGKRISEVDYGLINLFSCQETSKRS